MFIAGGLLNGLAAFLIIIIVTFGGLFALGLLIQALDRGWQKLRKLMGH